MTTYILDSETGVSLQAAGWHSGWYSDGRSRYDQARTDGRVTRPYLQGVKQRWEVGEPGPFPAYPSFPVDPNMPQRSLFDLVDLVNGGAS